MSNMIHINDARKIFESKQPFSIKFWKENGDVVVANEVVLTSSNFERNTINIRFLQSNQVRKVKVVTIFEVNDLEIYL